ncbi:MAG: hypothetical protein Q4A71_01290 [Actinomycetaceae bacterium]|nr:hypothetical protein [Actinomycetaceae bacterium]
MFFSAGATTLSGADLRALWQGGADALTKKDFGDGFFCSSGINALVATLQAALGAVEAIPPEAGANWWSAEFADALARNAEGRTGVTLAAAAAAAARGCPPTLRPLDFADYILRLNKGFSGALGKELAWSQTLTQELSAPTAFLSIDQVAFTVALPLLFPETVVADIYEGAATVFAAVLCRAYNQDTANSLVGDPMRRRLQGFTAAIEDGFEVTARWSTATLADLEAQTAPVTARVPAVWTDVKTGLAECSRVFAAKYASPLAVLGKSAVDITIRPLTPATNLEVHHRNVVMLHKNVDARRRMAIISVIDSPGIARELADLGSAVILAPTSANALLRAELTAKHGGADLVVYLCGSGRAREYAALRAKLCPESVHLAGTRNDLEVRAALQELSVVGWVATKTADLRAVVDDTTKNLGQTWQVGEDGVPAAAYDLLLSADDGPLELAAIQDAVGGEVNIIYGGAPGPSLLGVAR